MFDAIETERKQVMDEQQLLLQNFPLISEIAQ